MTAPATPTFPVLGASTLNRKWIVEVDTGTGSPTWTMVGGITNCKFEPDNGNWVDDSVFSDGGPGSETKTNGKATVTLMVSRKIGASGTTYDVGQEKLRLSAVGKYGPSNTVSIRICEYDPEGGPRVEAYTGKFGVDWVPQGGDDKALDLVQVTLHGQGSCAPISHPYPAA